MFHSMVGFGLTYIHWTEPEKFAKGNHSNLLGFIDSEKKVYNINTGANVINLFCPWFTDFHTKLECLLE